MKPHEFWNSRYHEISIFCQSHLARITDELKKDINLQEAVTNKLLQGDAMRKNPRIISIRDSYKDLFKDDEKDAQTPEEIIKKMRSYMKSGRIL